MFGRKLLALVPAAALALCLYAVGLPFFVETPGSADDVLPLIDIQEGPTHQPEGRLLLTTVHVARLNAYYGVWAWFDPEARLVPERQVIPPGITERQYDVISRSQMDESKIAAVAVALEFLGDYPEDHGPGVVVQNVLPGSPAEGRLFPGDLIRSVDGRPLDGLDELSAAVNRAGTARALELEVHPVEGGAEGRTVSIRPAILEGEDRPLLGIVPVENFPYRIRIESGRVGGPSAGLMWALGVTDWLTPGDLLGGRTVAGTGTVGLDGSVGPVGGVDLKVAAARNAGADVFLVPRSNLAEAAPVAGELEVIPVSTVREAIEALEDG